MMLIVDPCGSELTHGGLVIEVREESETPP